MEKIGWKQFVGQNRIKEVLEAAFFNQTMGHAYLFCGDMGTGKFAAAFELAMAVHCESAQVKPCYECDSCRKMLHYSHPDFHVIMPVSLQKEHRSDSKLTEQGWKYISECVNERIREPYLPRMHSGIPNVPVDWVREVNHAIHRGALKGGRNIAILDGIEMMSKESANAMLKTLEEPPAGTLMILISQRLHTVLPTIVSRCQILRFSCLSPEQISSELVSRYGIAADDDRLKEVVNTGSLGQSIYLWENPDEEASIVAQEFWALCVKNDWIDIAKKIDQIALINNYSSYEKMFIQIMNLIRNSFFDRIVDTENYIMGICSPKVALDKVRSVDQLEQLLGLCEQAINRIRSRAAISLVLVDFAISVMEKLNGKK
ncbi:MAG: hypothetical protein GXY77_16430 [Fibrobacter sp.]|nr:hypothetical protein [Fibrobacter sp.]